MKKEFHGEPSHVSVPGLLITTLIFEPTCTIMKHHCCISKTPQALERNLRQYSSLDPRLPTCTLYNVRQSNCTIKGGDVITVMR